MEPLPVNGTIIMSNTEADDIVIDAIPPEEVSIVVTNTTVTVTNNPVEISDEASETLPPMLKDLVLLPLLTTMRMNEIKVQIMMVVMTVAAMIQQMVIHLMRKSRPDMTSF